MSDELLDAWRTFGQRMLRTPRFWLALEVAVLAAILYGGGRFELVTFPDSPTYTALIGAPLADAMTSRRTLAYPLLLSLVQRVSPDYQWLPWIQFFAFCGAVLAMGAALRRWGAAGWQALLAETGLLWACLLNRELVGSLLTDMPGLTAAIAATAFLLMVVATPNKTWPWIAMTLSVALAYQIRPAYLFLVGFAPVAGLLLRKVRAMHDAPVWPWFRFAGALTGATVVPLVAYFCLRWAMVGEFGLVSFGGYNMVGMAIELLNPETIERDVPEHLRPLAREIVAKRESIPCPRAYAQGVRRAQYRYFNDSYHANVELTAIPVIEAHFNCPKDYYQINRICTELLRPVLSANKLKYAKIILISFTQSLDEALQWYTGKYWLPSWFRGIVKFLSLGALGILAFRLGLQRRWSLLRGTSPWRSDGGLSPAFWLVACLFVTGNMLLVSATSTVIPRYTFAAVALVPAAVLMWVAREWMWAMEVATTAFARGRRRLAAIYQEVVTLRTRIETLEAELAALKDSEQTRTVLSGGDAFQQDVARQRSAA